MRSSDLRLKKDQERRLLAGHCWVYSNEVNTDATPLSAFEPGQPVTILSHRGRRLGQGYVNPQSLICARLLTRESELPLTSIFWIGRVRRALELRERLYARPFYRLIYGEGDSMPGLTVDRYGDLLAVQITTAGMERLQAQILAALEQVVRPKYIVLRNDTPVRELEGLAQGVETVLGDAPPDWELVENGTRHSVPVLGGQKTGWFYDQADNRRWLPRLGRPARVLDLFCYTGAWGIQAAAAGAPEVQCVDSSQAALDRLAGNAERNGLRERIQTIRADAFDLLRSLRERRERFDLVILDPPAFIKRRKDEKEGARAYQRINRLGMSLVAPGGLLVTSSCSFHLGRDAFVRILQQAARHAGRGIQLLRSGGQGPDHPVHPAIAETAYLKTCFLRVLPEF